MAADGDPSQEEYLRTVHDPRLIVSFRAEREGKARAYNRVLAHLTSSPLVFLVSADVGVDPSVFGHMMAHFHDPRLGVAVPRVQPSNSGTMATRVARVLWDLHDVQLGALPSDSQNVHGGEFVAIRGELLTPFPENLINDDAYLCVQAIKRGFRLRYAREVVVQNEVPRSLRELLRQRRRVNYGHWQLSELGLRPAILTSMFTQDLRSAFRILARSVREYPQDIPYLPALALEEGFAIVLSHADRHGPTDHTKWAMVERESPRS